MARNQGRVGENKSEIVAALPRACTEEAAAVEFLEQQRWGDSPTCPHCKGTDVYKMLARDGQRNKLFRWRCRECKQQYTVKVGTVMEDSPIPVRHWNYALWRACTSKKGVAALEIKRQCGLSYKSALFMMHRINFAMARYPDKKMSGIIEVDEAYVGGVPRKFAGNAPLKRGRGTTKTPVVAVIQRDGDIRVRALTRVTARNLRDTLLESVDPKGSKLMTDDFYMYRKIGKLFGAGHESVTHSAGEYSHGDAHCNTCESFFALLKRSLHGIHHAVSKKHLHRYLAAAEFRFAGRKLEDGERVVAAIKGAEGKRLFYRVPAA